MAKPKQLIERALPFAGRYIYQDITRGNIMDGQCTTCDNCGALIANMVNVRDAATRKVYHIGTDCAETFRQAGCLLEDGRASIEVDLYGYNKAARVATELRKGKPLVSGGVFATITTDKGKTIDCDMFQLRQYFPELVA